MAVRVQVIAAFAQGSQWAPGTWERVTGELSKAGFAPKGAPGGGRGSAHYTEDPLASALLAAAMHTTNETPEIVSRLEGLQALPPAMLVGGGFAGEIVQRGMTLRGYLKQEITRWASPTAEMLAQLAAEQRWVSAWTLELIPSGPWANLRVHTGNAWVNVAFAPDPSLLSRTPAGIRRKAELTLPILKIAGDLLADTLARQGPSSASGSMLSLGGGMNPESKTAASDPARDQSAAEFGDQSATTDLGGKASQSHLKVEREKAQPGSEPRAGRSFDLQRSVHNDRREPRHGAALGAAA